MSRVDRLAAALAIVAVALASCGLAGIGQPRDEPAPGAPVPIGPVVELGQGRAEGLAWRYSVYESDQGSCTRLEVSGPQGGGSGESCGAPLGAGAEPLVLAGVGAGTNTYTQVEGFASAEVAEVWIETDDLPVAAVLMMMEGLFDLEGQAFVAFVPPERTVGDAYALDASGEEIGRVEVDVPGSGLGP